MSSFHDLRYVNQDGTSAPVDTSATDNPYFGQTTLAKTVLMGDLSTIQWRTEQHVPHELRFKSPTIAMVDPSSNLLIVVLHFNDPEFRRPANAAAFTATGLLDHIIAPPLYVEQIVEQLPGRLAKSEKYPVEAMTEVLLKNNRTLIGLNFRYEWIERRFYDPANREWLESNEIYRR